MNNPYQAPMMNNPYIQSQNPYMDRMNFLQNYQQSLQQPLVPTQMSGANQQAMPIPAYSVPAPYPYTGYGCSGNCNC